MFTQDQFAMAFMKLYAKDIHDDQPQGHRYRLYRLPDTSWVWMRRADIRLDRVYDAAVRFYDTLMHDLGEKTRSGMPSVFKQNVVLAYRCAEALVVGRFPKEVIHAFGWRLEDMDLSIPDTYMVDIYRRVMRLTLKEELIEKRLSEDYIDLDYQRISHNVFCHRTLERYQEAARFIEANDPGSYESWGRIACKAQDSPSQRMYQLRLVDSYLSTMILENQWEVVVRKLKFHGYRLSPDVLIAALSGRFVFHTDNIVINKKMWLKGCSTDHTYAFNNLSVVFGMLVVEATAFYRERNQTDA